MRILLILALGLFSRAVCAGEYSDLEKKHFLLFSSHLTGSKITMENISEVPPADVVERMLKSTLNLKGRPCAEIVSIAHEIVPDGKPPLYEIVCIVPEAKGAQKVYWIDYVTGSIQEP